MTSTDSQDFKNLFKNFMQHSCFYDTNFKPGQKVAQFFGHNYVLTSNYKTFAMLKLVSRGPETCSIYRAILYKYVLTSIIIGSLYTIVETCSQNCAIVFGPCFSCLKVQVLRNLSQFFATAYAKYNII